MNGRRRRTSGRSALGASATRRADTAAVRGGEPDPLGAGNESRHRAVVMDSHAGVDACAAQSPGELRRVDDRGAIVDPEATVIRGRRDLGAHRIGVERVHAVTVRTHRVCDLDELLVLPRLRRHVDHPGAFEIAIDPVLCHGCLDGVEVLHTEPLQGVELGAEPAHAIGETMGQAGVAEAAVATRRGRRGASPFEERRCRARDCVAARATPSTAR